MDNFNNNDYSDNNNNYGGNGYDSETFGNSGYNDNYGNNSGYQEQQFSGVDGFYNSGAESASYLGAVEKSKDRPGCLVSFLAFFINIALIVIVTVVLMIFTTEKAASNCVDEIVDASIDLFYEEMANDTDLNETLEMVDTEFEDIVSDDFIKEFGNEVTDLLVNGIENENGEVNLDYDAIADGMCDVSEKVLDEALDCYIEGVKTGEMSEEAEVLDEFLYAVVGYDLQSEFMAQAEKYDVDEMNNDRVLAQIKEDTKKAAMDEIKVEVDKIVYDKMKTEIDDVFDEMKNDEEMQNVMSVTRVFPLVMKACLVGAIVLMVLQLLMYKQKYRAIRNFSVVAFMCSTFFGMVSAILFAVTNEMKNEPVEEGMGDMVSAMSGLAKPFYFTTACLAASFVILLIVSIIMRASHRNRYV